jgi:lysophospholipase L1-like esterase
MAFMLNRKSRRHRPHAKPRNRMRRRMRTAVALFGLAMGAVSGAHAQVVVRKASLDPAAIAALDARWKSSLDEFAALDQANAPAQGGVVFVGSSSIRLWNGLESQFGDAGTTIVKRGFGGSRLSDCARYVARLVLPYKPSRVVVYAGDNDLAEGASPDDVAESFKELTARIHEALPEARVTYVSIKPSPLRESLMAAAIQANEKIEAYTKTDPRLAFVDIYTPMLDGQGQPRAELFLPDRLHLNADGYAIWRSAIAASLRR